MMRSLAEKLGYSDKRDLKRLAERHASELAEFGISATVAVLSNRGNGAVVTVYEPTYNPDQAAYLALSSETEQGRACRGRMVLGADGEPWFVAKDLVEAVGAVWEGNPIKHIPEEYRGVNRIQTLGGPQNLVTLNESGMNFYLIRSDKPSALPLQKKIASEVLAPC